MLDVKYSCLCVVLCCVHVPHVLCFLTFTFLVFLVSVYLVFPLCPPMFPLVFYLYPCASSCHPPRFPLPISRCVPLCFPCSLCDIGSYNMYIRGVMGYRIPCRLCSLLWAKTKTKTKKYLNQLRLLEVNLTRRESPISLKDLST